MAKKYLKVSFNLANSKKRSVTVKNVQSETSDENLKKLGEFVEKFIDGTKKETIKVVETTLEQEVKYEKDIEYDSNIRRWEKYGIYNFKY